MPEQKKKRMPPQIARIMQILDQAVAKQEAAWEKEERETGKRTYDLTLRHHRQR